jgi:hypothetical protein
MIKTHHSFRDIVQGNGTCYADANSRVLTTPSGILCRAMAHAMLMPIVGDFMVPKNTATPSGKLCTAIPIAVIRPLSNDMKRAGVITINRENVRHVIFTKVMS